MLAGKEIHEPLWRFSAEKTEYNIAEKRAEQKSFNVIPTITSIQRFPRGGCMWQDNSLEEEHIQLMPITKILYRYRIIEILVLLDSHTLNYYLTSY